MEGHDSSGPFGSEMKHPEWFLIDAGANAESKLSVSEVCPFWKVNNVQIRMLVETGLPSLHDQRFEESGFDDSRSDRRYPETSPRFEHVSDPIRQCGVFFFREGLGLTLIA